MPSSEAHPNRYECRWREEDGRDVHYWVDHYPEDPHWPQSRVMRWDLRQKDWHLIWPELIDHPCALLFAPTHPHREGPPRFRDWVRSWPAGFDWQREVPEQLHAAVRAALEEAPASETTPAVSTPAAQVKELVQPDKAPRSRVEDLVEELAVVLLELDRSRQSAVSHLLATLVLAPDSGRIVQALKRALLEEAPSRST